MSYMPELMGKSLMREIGIQGESQESLSVTVLHWKD